MATSTEKKPFWSDTEAQEQVTQELKEVVQKTEAWWIILVAPSCLIRISDAIGSYTQSLWGHTHEGYGEAVADSFVSGKNPNLSFCRGIVYRILRIHPELRKEVLKALLKEQVDGVPLSKQNLYRTMDY